MTVAYARVHHAWTPTGWREWPLIRFDDEHWSLVERPATAAAPRLDVTLLPAITDAHVHVHLADPAPGTTRLGRVLDLGGPLPGPDANAEASAGPIERAIAGQFLTVRGGYPVTRDWAPADSVAELDRGADAAAVVARQRVAGASVIKVTINEDAPPAPSTELLRAIVDEAHAFGLRVVAHAEGSGSVGKALDAGVDALAHSPWTHRLSDEMIEACAARTVWISTLSIHTLRDDRERATENAARFLAAGGRLRYGTDLGNGTSSLDLNDRELDALIELGLTGDALLLALTADGILSPSSARCTLVPGSASPDDAVALVRSTVPSSPAALWTAL